MITWQVRTISSIRTSAERAMASSRVWSRTSRRSAETTSTGVRVHTTIASSRATQAAAREEGSCSIRRGTTAELSQNLTVPLLALGGAPSLRPL